MLKDSTRAKSQGFGNAA